MTSEMSPKMKAKWGRMKAIVRRIIKDALAQGYALNLSNGGDGMELPAPTTKFKEIDAACYATDDEHLYFYKDGKRVGWVWLIYANSSWEVITDYTANDATEAILKGANELAEKYSDKFDV